MIALQSCRTPPALPWALTGTLSIVKVLNYYDRTKRRDFDVEWLPDRSLLDYRNEHAPEDVNYRVSLNGRLVPEQDLSKTFPHPGHQIVFVPVPENNYVAMGLTILAVIVEAVAEQYWAIPLTISAGSVVSTLLNTVKKPLTPDSPSVYTFTPQTVQQQGLPVPRWYGTIKLFGNVIMAYTGINYAVNRGGETDYQNLSLLIDLGYGPYESLTDHKINDQPITSFNEISMTTLLGYMRQPPVTGFNVVKDQYDVAVQVFNGTSNMGASDGGGPYIYLTSGNDFDALEVDLAWPDGIWGLNDDGYFNGELAARVEIQPVVGTISNTNVPNVTNLSVSSAFTQIPGTIINGVIITSSWTAAAGAAFYEVWIDGVNTTRTTSTSYATTFLSVIENDPNYPSTFTVGIYAVYSNGQRSLFASGTWVYSKATNGTVSYTIEGAVSYTNGPYLTDGWLIIAEWDNVIYLRTSQILYTAFSPTNLVHGQYRIRITKLTVDNFNGQPDGVWSWGDRMFMSAEREVYYDDFSYPRHVLVGITALATGQLSGGVGYSCIANALLVRQTTDGVNWTVAWSNSPAWVAFDILTQPVYDNNLNVLRYDGKDPSQFDVATFMDCAAYCLTPCPDGTGPDGWLPGTLYSIGDLVYGGNGYNYSCINAGTSGVSVPLFGTALSSVTVDSGVEWENIGTANMEPLVTFNGGFDKQTDPWTASSQVLSLARSRIVHNGVQYKIVTDTVRATTQVFTMADMEPDSYEATWLPLSSRASEIDGANFMDKSNDYISSPTALYNPNVNDRFVQASIDLTGITSFSEAYRQLSYHLAYNEFLLKSHKFKVHTEGLVAMIGDVVNFMDEITPTGSSGKIVSATGSTVTLDQQVTIDSSGAVYMIMIRHTVNGVMEEQIITNVAGTYSTLSISGAWTLTPVSLDAYAFGKQNIYLRKIQITDKETDADQFVTVSAIDYNESIYGVDQQLPIVPTNTATDIVTIPPVTGVTAQELIITSNTGVPDDYIDVYWVNPSSAYYNGAEVWYQYKGGPWTFGGSVGIAASTFRMSITQGGEYEFAVVTVNMIGQTTVLSAAPTVIVQALGKTTPPANVPNFGTGTPSYQSETWEAGTTWETGTTWEDAVKSNAAFLSGGFTAAQNGDFVVFSWPSPLSGGGSIADYEIRYNPLGDISWGDGTTITKAEMGTHIVTAKVGPGSWTFMICSQDIWGNYSTTPATCSLTVLSTNTVINGGIGEAERGWPGLYPPVVVTFEPGAVQWEAGTTWEDTTLSSLPFGTSQNFSLHWTNVLVPKSQGLASDDGWDTFDKAVPNPYPIYTYTSMELRFPTTVQCRAHGEIYSKLLPGVTGSANPQLQIEYKVAGGSYQGFTPWTIGDISAQAVVMQFIMLTSSGLAYIIDFVPTLDAEQRTVSLPNTSISSGGTVITYDPPFLSLPNVQATPVETGGSVSAIPSYQTVSGCTITLYNTVTGVAVDGIANITILGV